MIFEDFRGRIDNSSIEVHRNGTIEIVLKLCFFFLWGVSSVCGACGFTTASLVVGEIPKLYAALFVSTQDFCDMEMCYFHGQHTKK